MKKIDKASKNVCIILLMTVWLMGCGRRPAAAVSGIRESAREETMSTGSEWTESLSEYGLTSEEISESEDPQILVYVCGAVECPGVYTLSPTSRVYEAIQAAGGFRQDADQEWLNQAGFLQDGTRLRIYTMEETALLKEEGALETELYREPVSGKEQDSGRININTATREELMTLPGIGEAKADAVISYREEQGNFQTIEDIMKISGIKEAVFLKIKDKIVV